MQVTTKSLPNIRVLFRKYFLAGLLVVIPIGVIVWLVTGVLEYIWQLHQYLPDAWSPETYIHDPNLAGILRLGVTLGFIVSVAFGISVLGWFSRVYLGKKSLELIEEIILRIPVLRGIYTALNQMLRALTVGGGQQFHRVVYLEYPRKGLWTLAFVTGPAKGPAVPPHHLNVYVPTTPNPTSGFYLIVPENEVRESQMKVDEAFKTILSLGIAQQQELPDE